MKGEVNDLLKLYPDPNSDALKDALANYYSVEHNQVFVGNGSDEVLAHIFQGLLKQDKAILFPDISYSFYPVYCGLYKIDHQDVPLTDSFEIDPADYQQPNGGIIFPNPNAPTGRLLALDAVKMILAANPDSVVVVDEAYIDFGGESAISLVKDYENLLVVQTFSKSRSLAGLRVGFAIGHADLIDGLERVKNSFNSYPLDRLSIAAGVASIEDEDYFQQSCQRIIDTRNKVTEELNQLGFDVLPSGANFVFTKHPKHDASAIAQALREKAIIVRHFKQKRIDQFLRITIGTDEECHALIEALKTIV
jgi:histidinol-phosphate aminotransferase